MDAIIFLKAIGNLLFTAILFLAVMVTFAFSMLSYILRGFGPALSSLRSMMLTRVDNRSGFFQLGKKILPQKKF
ncbi:hypothetical protein [Dyadobacter crusticola]|uniref:hypothetical protein n=1 Tax=Dyadobacter crusticola TaxID=292407 RepID=UPI000A02DE0E|nr:hypothetical protein [Dyadobacter crusticola]